MLRSDILSTVGILANEGPDKTPLAFSIHWSISTFDHYLRQIYPQLFKYLDLVYGLRDGTDDQYHWQLVRRVHDRVIVYDKTMIDGRDILACCFGAERAAAKVGLMIGMSLVSISQSGVTQ